MKKNWQGGAGRRFGAERVSAAGRPAGRRMGWGGKGWVVPEGARATAKGVNPSASQPYVLQKDSGRVISHTDRMRLVCRVYDSGIGTRLMRSQRPAAGPGRAGAAARRTAQHTQPLDAPALQPARAGGQRFLTRSAEVRCRADNVLERRQHIVKGADRLRVRHAAQ